MNADAPPAIIITHVERHDLRDEVLNHVARLLCEADGCDLASDIRCGDVDGKISATTPMTITCNAVAMPYPTYMRWYTYRDKAEKLLRDIFKEENVK